MLRYINSEAYEEIQRLLEKRAQIHRRKVPIGMNLEEKIAWCRKRKEDLDDVQVRLDTIKDINWKPE